jgi:hypothetical protein
MVINSPCTRSEKPGAASPAMNNAKDAAMDICEALIRSTLA